MALEDDLVELVETQESEVGRLLQGAASALRGPLSAFQGWDDHQAIRGLSELLGAILRGFESVAARSADSYMARAISITTGKRFEPVGTRRTQLGRTGADNATVLGRIANQYRYTRSEADRALIESARSGKVLDIPDPTAAAFDRLDRIIGTNLQMATRHQARTTMAASTDVTHYRRIIHPELAEVGTCGLCIAASDREYRKAELLPIHPECHCTVLPGTKKFDPQTVNEIDFGKIYTDAGGTSAEQLRKTRYRVDEHGEIGPVIRPEDEPIRTKRQAAKASKTPEQRRAAVERKRQQMESEHDALARKIKAGEVDPEAFTPVLDQLGQRLDSMRSAA